LDFSCQNSNHGKVFLLLLKDFLIGIFDQRANSFRTTGQVVCDLVIPMKLLDLGIACEFFQTKLTGFCLAKSQ